MTLMKLVQTQQKLSSLHILWKKGEKAKGEFHFCEES